LKFPFDVRLILSAAFTGPLEKSSTEFGIGIGNGAARERERELEAADRITSIGRSGNNGKRGLWQGGRVRNWLRGNCGRT